MTTTHYIPGQTSYTRDELNLYAARYNISNDRVYGDDLQLKYDVNDIVIPTNSIITSDIINNVANKLFENYMHILSRCKVAKTDAFSSYRGFFELTEDNTMQPNTGYYSTDPINSITNNMLDGNVTTIDLINTIQPGVYGMVISTRKSIQLYNFVPSYKPYMNGVIVPVSQQQGEAQVETNNQLEFDNIQKVILDNRDYMYVYDSGRYVLYKYNIKGLTRQDKVLLEQETRGRQLVEVFGGRGSVSTPTQFNNVIDLTLDELTNQIYVLDRGDDQFYIKMYDDQLNWLDSYNISIDFRNDTPLKIKIHKDRLYILTETGSLFEYKLSELQSGIHDATNVIDLDVVDFDFVDDEYYMDIVFSSTSGNMCYVHTNKTVYKKYLTRMDKIVATIAWSKHDILGGYVQPTSMMLHNRANTTDDIMLITGVASDGETRLMHFIDAENVQEMLARNYEDQIYILDDITIDPNETVSSFVYNKFIYKFMYNNLAVLNNLKYIATIELGFEGNFIYPGIRYISQQEINNIITNRNDNVYIGVNELVTTGVLNRVLRDIVIDQKLLLDALVDRRNKQEFYDSTVLVMKKTPVPHLKHMISTQTSPKTAPLLGGAHKIVKL